MHHVVALIAERQGGGGGGGVYKHHALIGLCFNCYVLCALCPRLDTKKLSSRGSHWKQSLCSCGVEVRLSTSYHPQTLP
ncbi:hypothetical protein Hanom_Chr14g01249451 [Helianthus anomalus]